MHDGTSADLLDELNQKRKRLLLTPWLVILAIVACVLSFYQDGPTAFLIAAMGLFGVGVVIAAMQDAVRKTSVLLYDLDADMLRDFADLTAAFEDAARSDRIWYVRSVASVYDRKYHAGAGAVLNTDIVSFRKSSPPRVKTNILPLAVTLNRKTLYLLPDRALILDNAGYGSIEYRDLRVETTEGTFVTGERQAPKDAKVVEYTWQFVNKRGGPDRRFSNNPQLPKIETRDVAITTSTGFYAQLKFSNGQAARHLADQLSTFASKDTAAVPPKVGGNGARDGDVEKHQQGQIRGSVALFSNPLMVWVVMGAALAVLLLNPARTGQRRDAVRVATTPSPGAFGGAKLPLPTLRCNFSSPK